MALPSVEHDQRGALVLMRRHAPGSAVGEMRRHAPESAVGDLEHRAVVRVRPAVGRCAKQIAVAIGDQPSHRFGTVGAVKAGQGGGSAGVAVGRSPSHRGAPVTTLRALRRHAARREISDEAGSFEPFDAHRNIVNALY